MSKPCFAGVNSDEKLSKFDHFGDCNATFGIPLSESIYFITHTHIMQLRGRVCNAVYLSVFFPCDISKTDELGSPNLTQKCSTMSPGKSFTLGSKCQISRSRVTKTALLWVFAPLWVLAASSGLDLLLVCLQYCKCNFRTFIGKTALPSTLQWCLYQQLSNWWWSISCHYAANPLYVSSAVIM